MGIIGDVWNGLTGLFSSANGNPDAEITDILGDFNRINDRLSALIAKHEKADKEALMEIDVVKADMEQKLTALDAQHNALVAAQQRAASISKKISDLIS